MGARSARPKPDRLAEKLKQVRQSFGYTLEEMSEALQGVKKSPPSKSHVLRFETGEREPSLLVLLEYSRVARCPLELIVDDELDLKLASKVKKKR